MSETFAVIKAGGKQYKVKAGDSLKIEKIAGKEKGDKITFSDVLLVDDGATTKIGTPVIAGTSVEGEVMEVGRNKKIVVIHYKQKSRYYKKAGHRQPNLKVKIVKINL
jgi:large subunit ribosomal protein L21